MQTMETETMTIPKTIFASSLVALCLLSLPALAQDAPAFIPIQGALSADDGTPRAGMFTFHWLAYCPPGRP